MKNIISTLLLLCLAMPCRADLTTNLLAAYHLNEGSGDATDATGNGKTLTAFNSPGTTTGKLSGARTFNGSNQYFGGIGITSGAKANLSIAFWANATSSNLISNGWTNTDQRRFGAHWGAGGAVYVFCESGGACFANSESVSAGTHHFALTYDGSQTGDANRLKLYVDGSAKSLSFSGTVPATYTITGDFEIGRISYASTYSNGWFDEVLVYDRTLSGAEVTSLFNSNNGVAYPFTGGGAAGAAMYYYMMQQGGGH